MWSLYMYCIGGAHVHVRLQVFYHSDLEAIATVLLRHPQVLVFSGEVFESIQFTGLSLPRFAAIHGMYGC